MGEQGLQRALVVRPGEGRRHAHKDEDDSFYILEGELMFIVEDEELIEGPGTFVLVPPGVPHAFADRGDAVVRLINVHAPAGFDVRMGAG